MHPSTTSPAALQPLAPGRKNGKKLMLALMLCLACDLAFAQAGEFKVTENLQWAKDILISAALIVFTGLTIFTGIEIAANKKRLTDVWQILVGAGISGAAAVIAAVLF